MNDLVNRLRKAILARRALAEAAPHDTPWVADTDQDRPGIWAADLSQPGRCDQHEPGKVNLCDDRPLLWAEDDDPDYAAVLAHTAANDPATIIRHCRAELAIIDEHAPNTAIIGGRELLVCRTCFGPTRDDVEAYLELDLDDPRAWEFPQARNLHWPCLTIRLIAEAYGLTKDMSNWCTCRPRPLANPTGDHR